MFWSYRVFAQLSFTKLSSTTQVKLPNQFGFVLVKSSPIGNCQFSVGSSVYILRQLTVWVGNCQLATFADVQYYIYAGLACGVGQEKSKNDIIFRL